MSTVPTQGPTALMKTVSIEAWVLTAVFLALFFIAHYISRFLIAFLNGLSSKVSVELIKDAKSELSGPLSHGLRVTFLTLAYFFLPVNIIWLMDTLFYILRLYQWLVIFYACVNVSRLLILILDYFLVVYSTSAYVRKGVVEFLYIVRFILLVIVFLVLVSFYPPRGSTDVIVSIFLSVNMVTATLVVVVAPLLRALVAGLSILVDQQVKEGEVVSMSSICKVGRLVDLSLRQVTIESFEDGSIIHVPTTIFLRNSVTKCDDKKVTVATRFPLKFDMPVSEIRALMEILTSRHQVSAWLDEDYNIAFEQTDIELESYDAVRTEMILNAILLFQERNVQLRS